MQSQTPKLLVVEPVNGLCNRLRAMASGWILAQHLNREFKVLWKATEDIGYTKFTDLFQDTNLLITEDALPIDIKVYISGIQTETAIIPDVCKDVSPKILLRQTGGNYMPYGMDVGNFNTLKSQFYNTKLMPVKDVIDCVNRVSVTINIGECLGVHIRRTDRKNFTPSTETFALAIKRKLSEKNGTSSSKLFVCTDDPLEIEKLESLVPFKIVSYPKTRFARDSPASIKEALIEWLLLSRCSTVIYSHGSSFGYEACVAGKVTNANALELRTKREKSDNEKRNLPTLMFI